MAAMRGRVLGICAVTATLGLASCGGKSTPATTAASRSRVQPPAAELRWRRQVRAFTAGVVAELEQVQAATGGGPRTGPIGARLDARVFVSGSRRRSFIAALTALERCRPDIARAVPPAPSPVLVPARTALASGCDALASAAHSLRAAVSAAGSARRVDHGTLAFARGRAQDGVRLVVDALAILARASGRSG